MFEKQLADIFDISLWYILLLVKLFFYKKYWYSVL